MSSPDQKLLHLVKKFLSFTVDDAPNADHIVHCLRTQHREYQRKDLGKLKRQVQKVLKRIRDDEVANESADGSSKKRALELQEDDDYEKKARTHDEQRSMELNNSSVLNSGLTERYRKLNQERDAVARAEARFEARFEADADGAVLDDNENGGDDMMGGKAKRSNREPATKPASSSKQLKRKKNGSARRIGSSNGIDDGEQGGISAGIEPIARPSDRYADLGGMEEVLKQIRQLVEYPLVRPEVYRYLGVDPPRGVLLQGPPGCGKTHLANAIAGQLGVSYFRVSAPELVSGMSGESEARIRELFQAASDAAPSVVFLDELDAIAPKRSDGGSSRGMEKRMVAQLLTSLDMLDPKYNQHNAPVIVLGATNRPDSIDPALRRAGRFDREILLGVPDEDARIAILKTMTKDMKLDGDFNLKVLARQTPGYVGADIRSLTKEAAVNAINRIFKDVLKDQKLPSDMAADVDGTSGTNTNDTDNNMSLTPLTAEEMEPLFVTMDDFLKAIPNVQPSSQREGFATVPGVSWDDIGALGSIREELTLSVLEPIRNPEKFKLLGIPLPAGVMLYGPPGCGKTLLAKAIANESGANFISIKGPELLDKYVGESERSVRLVFERARSSSPCVVFFDELDSLCRKRGSGDDGGSGVSERVVNQLLTEMDGLESRRNVFVIAATNRPELIDPAMMRP
jgi:ribosome biogenesis ATPase